MIFFCGEVFLFVINIYGYWLYDVRVFIFCCRCFWGVYEMVEGRWEGSVVFGDGVFFWFVVISGIREGE